MEHEDNNASFANNYLRGNIDEFSLQQNQQNLVENRQIASGFGPGGIVSAVDEIGVSIGGKFVEEENDEEWKYIQEVQRSEKQQVLEGVENVDGVGVMFVDYECGGDGQSLQAEVDDEEEAGIIKNDGDFSTTSNTTSTTVGEEENSTAAEEELHEMQQAIDKSKTQPMFQVGMEAEVTKLLAQKNNLPSPIEESSLATGENSEMLVKEQEVYKKPEQYTDEESEVISGCMFSSSPPLFATNGIEKPEENENQSNTALATAAVIESHNYPEENLTTHKSPERPSELDFEMHSNLNPEAKEFVPIHSNPTSPISPNKSHDILDFESSAAEQSDASPVVAYGVEYNKENEEFFASSGGEDLFTADVGDFAENLTLSSVDVSPHPSAVPRHMIASNDVGLADVVLAQSPHKGRGLDMETISLPAENVFEHEAAMRPHEIEQEADDGKASDEVEAMTNGMEIGNHENKSRKAGDSNFHDDTGAEHEMQMPETTEDYSDFQNRLDHGPETSVDLDMDSPDMMKQSVYVENDVDMQQQQEIQHEHEQIEEQAIEELLNSVQPIPTDCESLNSSFTEGIMNTVNKEMLNVEEKEVVSHSPSIEELNMRYQNEYNVYSSETGKTLIDMDNAGHMQDSFYMEHTPAAVDTEAREPSEEIATREIVPEAAAFHATDVMSSDNDIIRTDTSHPQEINESSPYNEDASSVAILTERPAAMAPEEIQQFTDFTSEKVTHNELLLLSSPQSHEKQFIEEAKEDLDTGNEIANLEQKMGDLQLKHDGSLQKVDEVAASATPIDEDPFELIAPESQCEANASPAFEAEDNSQRQPPLDDPFTDDVVYKEVESKLQAMMTEERTTSALVQSSADPEMDDNNYASMIETGFGTGSSVPEAEVLEAPVSSAATSSPEPKIHSPSMDVAKTDASVNEPVLLEEVALSAPTAVPETTVEAPAVPITSHESAVAVNEPPVNQASASEGPVSTTKAAEPDVEKEDVLKAMAVGVAVATSATVAAAAAATVKKLDPAKKTVASKTTKTAAPKTKLAADSKKPADIKKAGAKPTTTATAARPRTAPSVGANKATATGLSEKRATASSATMTSAARPAAPSAAARKPIASRTISAKPPAAAAAKTTSSRTTAASSSSSKSTLNTARNGIASKTTASRPLTATRKPTTATSAPSAPVSAAAAAASKPQPAAGGAPVKPTTLGITAKPKALSPRPRITISQVSKSGAGLASTAAKSPLKTAATAATNVNGKTTSSTTNASSTNRTKTTSAPTKTFTARPAPKTTSAPITATTNHLGRRITLGSTTKTSTITSSSSVLRKSSPSKLSVGGKMSPTKTSVAPISKPKTKDVTLPKSATKAAPTAEKASAGNAIKEKQPLMEATVDLAEPPKLNGEPLGHTANGDANYNHGAENGLTEQGEMSLMDGDVA